MAVNTGQADMYYEGNWVVPRMAGEGMNPDDFGFFYFPAGTNRASWFAEFLCVSSTSQHKPEAIRFLDWISSPDVQARFAEWWGGIMPTLGVSLPEGSPQLLIDINDLLAKSQGIYLPADQALPLQVVTEGYWLAQDKLIVGEIKPEDAPGIVQASIDKYLEANPQ
jgi:ABC-type glycerol-3-phosphate transport system substrate-binding protein